MRNKFRVALSHDGSLDINSEELNSGIDLRIVGYRSIRNEKLSEEMWFDTNKKLSNMVRIMPNETILCLTGVKIGFPEAQEIYSQSGEKIGHIAIGATVRGRSGLSLKTDTNVKLGTIDNLYTGDIGVIFHNEGDSPYVLNKGDRIAQLVFEEVIIPNSGAFAFVDDVSNDQRGENGFGSSGVQ